MTATALVDTNILVYRRDPRDPVKQRQAHECLRQGLEDNALILPHQALVEFVAAVTRPLKDLGGESLMSMRQALFEVNSMTLEFPVVYPNEAVLKVALTGVRTHGLSWFDAQLWAHAEQNGIPELISEDFEHGRYYGRVRVRNPFLSGAEELPQMYA
jgi:predicted nucleic acid-binding protein